MTLDTHAPRRELRTVALRTAGVLPQPGEQHLQLLEGSLLVVVRGQDAPAHTWILFHDDDDLSCPTRAGQEKRRFRNLSDQEMTMGEEWCGDF